MKKEHKYAQAFRWMADGEDVQIQWGADIRWAALKDHNEFVHHEILLGEGEYRFRIKPKTIRIGDREIEAPVMSGDGYYITDHGDAFRWFGAAVMASGVANMQKLGRVFATEEAARAAQEAITALLTKEPS